MRRPFYLLLALALVGCATAPVKPAPVISTHEDVPIAKVTIPAMNLKGVQWQVYDLAKLKALVASMEANHQTSVVLYVLDQNNYEALVMNLAEMKRYITDQKSVNSYLIAAATINSTPTDQTKK